MTDLVVATRNKGKLEEIREFLKELPVRLLSLNDVGFHQEIAEDGATFKENAVKKAATVAKATGKLTIADDSGLEVDALQRQPGVFSARFAGPKATDHENNLKLLQLMKNIPEPRRTATFRCVIALASPDGVIGAVEGSCDGAIGLAEVGSNGFGYDPLFIRSEYNKTFAQLDCSVKNRVSHRAKALEKLSLLLENYLQKLSRS